MSGGPYGRGKAPERACLPIGQWPEMDRRLWLAACAGGDILDDEVGARSRHADISNTKAAKGYGRWLTYLARSAPKTLTQTPGTRITPETVRAYVEALELIGNSTQTILARLQELGEVARVMDGKGGWSFINEMASKIRARHRPARGKTHLRLSNELVDLGIKLIRVAENLVGLDAAITHRDGLLIGFLALVPLRRRNLANLVLEKTLISEGQPGPSPSGRTTPRPTPRSRSGCRMFCGLRSKRTLNNTGPSSWQGAVAGPVQSRARYGSPRMVRR